MKWSSAARACCVGMVLAVLGAREARAESVERPPAHGPASSSFPSHDFQLAPRSFPHGQVGVNFGLAQPILAHGFNVALEFRYRRLWSEYSHGQALNYTACRDICLRPEERDAHLKIKSPYTTGFGLGLTLVDEVWLGVEFKTHRYDVEAPGGEQTHYQTYSIGPVLGWRFFIYRGLHLNIYVRYWPNVYTDLPHGKWIAEVQGGGERITHRAHDLGFFANASLGWAFDLGPRQ